MSSLLVYKKGVKLEYIIRSIEKEVGFCVEKQGDYFDNFDLWISDVLNSVGGKRNCNVESVKSVDCIDVRKKSLFSVGDRISSIPDFIGPQANFFPATAFKEFGDSGFSKIKTPPFEFYDISDATILMLGEIGPIYFDSRGRLIEDLSSVFSKLLFFIDVDVKSMVDNARRENAGVVLLDRCLEPNYAHWLLDWMPRVMFKEGNEKLIMPALKSSWQRSLLNNFVKDSDCVFLDAYDAISCSILKIPSCGGRQVEHPACKGHPDVLNFLRSKLQVDLDQSVFPDVVCIYRKGSREIKNLYDVCDSYVEKGMSVCFIDCATVDVKKQWMFFKSAKIVVGAHGAALASSVFMASGAVLVEIFPLSYGNPAFWIASSGADVSYIGVTDVEEEDFDKKPRERGLRIRDNVISSFVEKSLQMVTN